MRIHHLSLLAILLIAPAALHSSLALGQTAPAAEAPNTTDQILHPADLDALIPPAVFFRGQTATVQKRNSGGVHFAGGPYMFAVKVDTGGYSSSIQEKYQTYFITEVPLDIDGHKLAPGAYGVGFVGDKFLVMDLGGHDLFTAHAQRDNVIARPTPLQVQADPTHGYRLYTGRDFVVFTRLPDAK